MRGSAVTRAIQGSIDNQVRQARKFGYSSARFRVNACCRPMPWEASDSRPNYVARQGGKIKNDEHLSNVGDALPALGQRRPRGLEL